MLVTTISNITDSIYPYRQLLVAFSGGLDSTVLLHRLMLWRKNNMSYDIKLRAIHIHHGLNIFADKWAEHCQLLCTEWSIPLIIERVILKNEGLGIEGQARKARYKVFMKTLLFGEVLVTAHHLDDQSETFLLALKRGSGPAGLSAMQTKVNFADTKLLRPMLGETRASLLNWAQINNLRWIEDESNQNDSYDRNFLRLHILPLFKKRWPNFAKAIARSADLCAEQENLLDELLSDELAVVIGDNGMLNIAPLVTMNAQRRCALLRRWLAANYVSMPSRNMLNRIWDEVAQARQDSSPCLCLKNYTIRRFRGQLWLVMKRPTLREMIIKWPDISNVLILPHVAGKMSLTIPGNIRLPLPDEVVSIRFKAAGMLHIVGHSGKYKLKRIFQKYNVPPWLRSATPLLFYNDTLIAAAGIFITLDGWTENGVQLEWKV